MIGTLAGCAAPLPRLAPPLPARWQNAVAAQPAEPTDLHGWWHVFGDRELDALVDRALAANLDVAQAVERLRAERTLQRHAHARYLPALSARTDNPVDPDATASYFVAGFDATWELGLFGRAEGTRREAQGALDASVADLRAAQVSLVAEVVREWIALRSAQRQEHLLTKISQARRQQWRLLKVRQQLQLASPDAVDRAQAAYAQSEASLAAPRQAINASARKLALLLGQNHPDASWLQPGRQPDLGTWQLAGTPAELLRTRPEIARAEADVLRIAGELAIAHADMYPNIGLGASYVWSAQIINNRKISHSPNGIGSLGPVLNIPLFDWGMRRAVKNAKGHELQAALLAYRQAVLQGVAEVETALGSLQQQEQREQQSMLAWQALRHADRAVQTRVKLQLVSPLDLAESRIAADQAAIELADARAAHSLAYAAVFKALGGAPLPAAEAPGASPAATAASSASAENASAHNGTNR
ncbi:MAG: efflux transporter outer membrane subunit [Pseudomonadota bacterium]|nr:efflux transporter outer membrane subunit [Pseudomonadota bacterium]